MEKRNFQEYSHELGRKMAYNVYGSGGKLCLAFPSQGGRYFDFEGFGLVESIRPWLEDGRVLLVCPDSIDHETWSKATDHPRERIELHEKWFHYITEELLARGRELGAAPSKAMAVGCSMGGIHAVNFFFRRPDLFDMVVSLSGTFSAGFFFHDYMDDLVYQNSPVHFLRDMPPDHPNMELYRNSRIILCAGQGKGEAELLAGTRELDRLLWEKSIPVWADYWGTDVSHDWFWWQKQLPYFLKHLAL